MNLYDFLTHLPGQPEWRANGAVTPASRASNGDTPLHAAIAQLNAPLARRLTDRGGSWEAINAFGCSVREAARRPDDTAIRALHEEEEAVSKLPGRIGHFKLESGHHSDRWLCPMCTSSVPLEPTT